MRRTSSAAGVKPPCRRVSHCRPTIRATRRKLLGSLQSLAGPTRSASRITTSGRHIHDANVALCCSCIIPATFARVCGRDKAQFLTVATPAREIASGISYDEEELKGSSAAAASSTSSTLFELSGGLPEPPLLNCFLNPLTHCQMMYWGSAIYYIHTIDITILVGLRPSKSLTPS